MKTMAQPGNQLQFPAGSDIILRFKVNVSHEDERKRFSRIINSAMMCISAGKNQ